MALAFASGSLITALATDLFAEPFRTGGVWLSGIGLLAGAAAFVVADRLLDCYIEGAGSEVSGFAILAAMTLDGVPENMALGVSLLQTSWTGALALLVAIFASNLPEALGGAVSMRDQGRTRGFAIAVWTVTAVILAAVVVGNAVLSGASEKSFSVLLSFAGGAVLASLAEPLCPPLIGRAASRSPSLRPRASSSRSRSRSYKRRALKPETGRPPCVRRGV